MRTSETLHIFGLCINSQKLKGFEMGDGWQIKHGAYEVLVRYEDIRRYLKDVLCFVMYNGVMIGSERYRGEQATPKKIEKFVANTISKYKKDTVSAEDWALQTVLLAVDGERESLIAVSDDDTSEYADYGDTGSVYDNDREDFHSDG